MSEPKTNAQKSQHSQNSLGSLILIVLVAIAIVVSLVLGGIRLFGGTSTTDEEPTSGPSIDPYDTNFNLEAWPSDQPLSSYGLQSGTLLILTDEDDYKPNADSLQTIPQSTTEYVANGFNMQLDKEAYEALFAMLTAMNNANRFDESVFIHTTYDQNSTSVAYRTGLAVRIRLQMTKDQFGTLSSATGDNPVPWFQENAWKYGFILNDPNNKNDIGNEVYRYVGIPHAYYIAHASNLEDEEKAFTLEDYVALVKKEGTAKKPIVIDVKNSGSDDGVYNVYYVAAKDADSALLREGAEIYGVSGVGDGYIVTSYMRTGDEPDEQEEDTSEEASSNSKTTEEDQ